MANSSPGKELLKALMKKTKKPLSALPAAVDALPKVAMNKFAEAVARKEDQLLGIILSDAMVKAGGFGEFAARMFKSPKLKYVKVPPLVKAEGAAAPVVEKAVAKSPAHIDELANLQPTGKHEYFATRNGEHHVIGPDGKSIKLFKTKKEAQEEMRKLRGEAYNAANPGGAESTPLNTPKNTNTSVSLDGVLEPIMNSGVAGMLPGALAGAGLSALDDKNTGAGMGRGAVMGGLTGFGAGTVAGMAGNTKNIVNLINRGFQH